MKNLLLSTAIGDIAGSVYEGRSRRTKVYDEVEIFHEFVRFTDDTVCAFACAEALLEKGRVVDYLHSRCRQHLGAGYGGRFYDWLFEEEPQPYNSLGNGSAMRCSSAGWLATSEAECERMAIETAQPTHNHPEGIKGAVASALTIFHLKNGRGKDYIKNEILAKYYPDWADKRYSDFHKEYRFDVTCMGTVPPAIICFLESNNYLDSIKLAISLGGDADTLAAIVGPMSYAFYKDMPQDLVDKALELLPDWMKVVNEKFDRACDGIINNSSHD